MSVLVGKVALVTTARIRRRVLGDATADPVPNSHRGRAGTRLLHGWLDTIKDLPVDDGERMSS